MQEDRFRHVGPALKQLRARARANGGDPFRDYRSSGKLPDAFEYGMNCMVDRVFETQGQEAAQLFYDVLKEEGHLTICPTRHSCDVADVPVLFGVVGQQGPLLAYNPAVTKGTRVTQETIGTLVHAEHPLVTFRLDDESEDERCLRLGMIDMALKERAIVLKVKGDHRAALIYEGCGDALERLAPILDSLAEVEDSETEADAMILAASALERVMPQQLDSLAAFLMVMASDFWSALWESLLDIFIQSHPLAVDDLRTTAESVSEMLRLEDFGSSLRFETRTADIPLLIPEYQSWLGPEVPNDAAAVLFAAAVCGSLGYGHEFPGAVMSADWRTQRCLFLELAQMNRQDLLPTRFGGGIGRFSPLLAHGVSAGHPAPPGSKRWQFWRRGRPSRRTNGST